MRKVAARKFRLQRLVQVFKKVDLVRKDDPYFFEGIVLRRIVQQFARLFADKRSAPFHRIDIPLFGKVVQAPPRRHAAHFKGLAQLCLRRQFVVCLVFSLLQLGEQELFYLFRLVFDLTHHFSRPFFLL